MPRSSTFMQDLLAQVEAANAFAIHKGPIDPGYALVDLDPHPKLTLAGDKTKGWLELTAFSRGAQPKSEENTMKLIFFINKVIPLSLVARHVLPKNRHEEGTYLSIPKELALRAQDKEKEWRMTTLRVISEGVFATCQNLGGHHTIKQLTKTEHEELWTALFNTDPRQMAHVYLEPVAFAVDINGIYKTLDPAALKLQDAIRIEFVKLCTETAMHAYLKGWNISTHQGQSYLYYALPRELEIQALGLKLEELPCALFWSRKEPRYRRLDMASTYKDPAVWVIQHSDESDTEDTAVA